MYKIHLNEDTHTYTVNGEVKQSVTQTLKSVGITEDYSSIDPYYRDRGTAVHTGCTLLAQGFLDWETVEDDCLPFIKTFKRIMDDLKLEYVSAEELCYDPKYYCQNCDEVLFEEDIVPERFNGAVICKRCGYPVKESYDICGKYDLIMMWNGKRTLIELKTGNFPMWGGLQLAAYERMVDVDDVMGISLSNGGKVFVKADDFLENTITWDDINCGTFDLDKWKSNRNRRCMKLLKAA
jgi:hypothetical protein